MSTTKSSAFAKILIIHEHFTDKNQWNMTEMSIFLANENHIFKSKWSQSCYLKTDHSTCFSSMNPVE